MRYLTITACLCLIVGCGNNQDTADGKIRVVSTTGMITDVAKNIAGERAEVIGLMGSGVDPHQYKASGGDVKRLRQADLILYNGLHLEAKMGEMFEKMNGKKKTVAVGENVPKEKRLLSDGTPDPHVWFDVSLWRHVADAIHKALVEVDPDGKAVFDANHEAYVKKLDELDAFVKKRVAELPKDQRVLVTAHDAFGYFGKAYGFEVMGLQGISTVSEAAISDVQKLASLIAERKIKAIFVETSVPRRNVEALQEAVRAKGFEVSIGGELFSDAMGSTGTEEGTYLGMVKHNVNTIVDALHGK